MPNSQAMMRLWIAWVAASSGDKDTANTAAKEALQHLPSPGVVAEASSLADPDLENILENALRETLQRLLDRTAQAISSDKDERNSWLEELPQIWSGGDMWASKTEPWQPSARWDEDVQLMTPVEFIQFLLGRLHETILETHPTDFREAAELYRNDLALAIVHTRNDDGWLKYVSQAATLIAGDDYPSYREMALAWLAAAALVQEDEKKAQKAMRPILAGALNKAEPAYVGDAFVALVYSCAQEMDYTLNTEDVAKALLMIPAESPIAIPAQTGGGRGSASERHDPWAVEMRRRGAVAAVLHRQRRVQEAKTLLEEATAQPESLSYAGYRTLANLSLACRWLEWDETDRAGAQIKRAEEDAGRTLDRTLRQERQNLVKETGRWLQSYQATPEVWRDVEACLQKAQNLVGMVRSTYLQFLSAIWSQDAARLKRLVPLAMDDRTASDAILGRLVGALVEQQALSPEQVDRLVKAMKLEDLVERVLTEGS